MATPESGTGPGGAQGAPPNAGNGSTGNSGGNAAPDRAGSQANGVPVDALPVELRGKTPAEIKVILDTTFKTLGKVNQTNKELQEKLMKLSGQQAAPPTEKKPDRPLEEEILENPEAAVLRVLEKHGLSDRFSKLETKTGEMTLRLVRADLDDFDKYEQTINEILTEGNLARTEENIRGAYVMAVGQEALEMKKRAREMADNPEKVGENGEPERKKVQLTPQEEEFARGMNMDPEKYVARKQFSGLKIPGVG